jgi:ketosteroid isomerase-like protein
MTTDVGQIEGRNKNLVSKAFDAWATGTGTGGVFELLADDATWMIVGNSAVSRTYNSRQEFLDAVVKPFNDRMAAPLVPTVRGLYADGDTVIAYFDGVATARDGVPYTNSYTWYLRMHDGRILNAVAFFDSIAYNELWNRVTPTV